MNIEIDIRRNDVGAIDFAFYKARAQRLRREAIIALVRTICERSLAWPYRRRKFRPRRAVRS